MILKLHTHFSYGAVNRSITEVERIYGKCFPQKRLWKYEKICFCICCKTASFLASRFYAVSTRTSKTAGVEEVILEIS